MKTELKTGACICNIDNVIADELFLARVSSKIAGEVQNEYLAKEAFTVAAKKVEMYLSEVNGIHSEIKHKKK